MIHALICPIRSRWRRHRYAQPFWRDDKTAAMLGIAAYGCRRCGRGATAERDALAVSDGDPTGKADHERA